MEPQRNVTCPNVAYTTVIHCWISENVEDKEISFKYIASSDNVSDILTNALFKPAFEELHTKMGLRRLKLGSELET